MMNIFIVLGNMHHRTWKRFELLVLLCTFRVAAIWNSKQWATLAYWTKKTLLETMISSRYISIWRSPAGASLKSGCHLRINSGSGDRSMVVRGTGVPSEREISLVYAGGEPRTGLSLIDLAEGLGAGTVAEERGWIYAGLRMVEKRFDDVAAGNCVAGLLDEAEYKRYAHLMPTFVKTAVGMLPCSDVYKRERRAVYARMRVAIESVRREDEEGAAGRSTAPMTDTNAMAQS